MRLAYTRIVLLVYSTYVIHKVATQTPLDVTSLQYILYIRSPTCMQVVYVASHGHLIHTTHTLILRVI